MAIFGAGSNWDGLEKKNDFFRDENFVIGWNYSNAKDLYVATAALKVGDIIYLKANAPGSRQLRVKGIGIVTKNFMTSIIDEDLTLSNFTTWKSLSIRVKWIVKSEFVIQIPNNEGRLTNIRAATFYEESLPTVQTSIILEILNRMQ
ncbi:hypothetical protein MUGA111182_04930 [Mucilaginibacter galii]|uniref:Uncharacterized protein n=1 Tax=Mucilaginibacter galii TaxID=2005073 RepID=A0A917N1S7_9SPHI|nr:hypothetical protein [Mucilaginibacter galii]GGI50779.1 hypothetical protein GCM10011425_19910 [Mucilaginibacter galii]